MSHGDSFGFDLDVREAWDAFRIRLADSLADMRQGDVVTIDHTFDVAETTDIPRGVQFLVWSADVLRCEVPSNYYLTGDRSLTSTDESMLVELGFNRPTCRPDEDAHGSPAFWVDLPYSWVDKLASMTVRVFQEVWGVPHPSFLTTSSAVPPDLVPMPFEAVEAPRELDLRTPITPLDVEHLRDLVEQTLFTTFDAHYGRDSDGDMEMTVGFTTAYIWSNEQRPKIHIHVPIVHDLTNRTRAAEVAAELNGRWPYFRAVVAGDRLYATYDLSANPFVPQHLYNALEVLLLILDGAGDDFAERLGGVFPKQDIVPSGRHVPLTPPEPANETDVDETVSDEPPSLLTQLLLLDPNAEGLLTPRQIADHCHNDHTVIAEFISDADHEVTSWRAMAADADIEGDVDNARAAEHEADAWSRTAGYLREALHEVVRTRPRSLPPQLDLFDNVLPGDDVQQSLFDTDQ